jgi:hypothetical protein
MRQCETSILLMGSTSVLVIGASFAGYNSWTSPKTLGLLISGVLGLVLAALYEGHRKENALIPTGILRNLNIINVLVISILHNFAFTAGTYFIPLYYQALHGTSPLIAGMQVLPFSLGAALATIPTARFIGLRPDHHWINLSLKISIASALALSAIGYGALSSIFSTIASSYDIIGSSLPPFPTHPPTCHSRYGNRIL